MPKGRREFDKRELKATYNGNGASPENGDSPERKLIGRLLEDIRDGTLARLLDSPDSEKDRRQLIANLGAIVTIQASLGVAKAVSDIAAVRSEGECSQYPRCVRNTKIPNERAVASLKLDVGHWTLDGRA